MTLLQIFFYNEACILITLLDIQCLLRVINKNCRWFLTSDLILFTLDIIIQLCAFVFDSTDSPDYLISIHYPQSGGREGGWGAHPVSTWVCRCASETVSVEACGALPLSRCILRREKGYGDISRDESIVGLIHQHFPWEMSKKKKKSPQLCVCVLADFVCVHTCARLRHQHGGREAVRVHQPWVCRASLSVGTSVTMATVPHSTQACQLAKNTLDTWGRGKCDSSEAGSAWKVSVKHCGGVTSSS